MNSLKRAFPKQEHVSAVKSCLRCPSGDQQGKKKESKIGMSTKKTEDFGKWYSELVVAAELISYYDVSGRPDASRPH